ncbi:MAG: hypothetical protein U9R53_12350 [Chloroflexota bacterium]|nr:hypothetical protein [Chloroflexota bacterium]
MTKLPQDIGFAYFTQQKYQIKRHITPWMKAIHEVGASVVIFESAFDRAVSEDAFISALENHLTPIVHFTAELPLARNFNNVAILLDVYAKWGVSHVIFGDQPNVKSAWPKAGWQYENLIDHFLDRFIPLANHAVRNGIIPVLAPLKPGGDYWDTAFIELVLIGLKRRRLEGILEHLMLSSYGYTYNKSLSWGKGGPERWSSTKPYQTPEGQENQIGFHNFKWVQAVGERAIGKKLPILILDAGHPGMKIYDQDAVNVTDALQTIYDLCYSKPLPEDMSGSPVVFDESVCWCTFSLDTIEEVLNGQLSVETFRQIFSNHTRTDVGSKAVEHGQKMISHYLLLPSYASGVSDAVLNKVRPLIKHHHATVGFSLEEAALAKKVSVYPDPILFSDEQLSHLRSTGSIVEILPESGIEIATLIQNS